MKSFERNQTFSFKRLNATQVIAAVMGVTLAIAGFHHGFFEALQGFKPTPGLIIQAIGPEHRFWKYGTEEAFTLLPNFFFAGVATMLMSVAVACWSIGFLHKKHGRWVFLCLNLLLFLVGGGIGFLVFLLLVWGYATRVNKPLKCWRKVLPPALRKGLRVLWPFSLSLAALFLIVALEISVFGYVPGLSDPDAIFAVCWTLLFASLGLINLSFISGFAHEIER